MKQAEYYIENVDLHAHPDLGEECHALASVAFDAGEPTFDAENGWLVSDCSIEVDLHKPEELNDEEGSMGDPDYGELTIEFKSLIEGDDTELEEVRDQWIEEGYQSLDASTIGKLENKILSDILAPVDSLVGDSISGILPRLRFTSSESNESAETTESEEEQDE